ncbi:hypothetical protein N9K16_05920 [Alphaproteobacteria bacterium]|nr:hypothetical protein [Alphaproteobacteria bacterium]
MSETESEQMRIAENLTASVLLKETVLALVGHPWQLLKAVFLPIWITALIFVGSGPLLESWGLSAGNWVAKVLVYSLVLIPLSSFVCSWHRALLLGFDRPRTGFGLFFRMPELLFSIKMVSLAIIGLLPLLAVGTLINAFSLNNGYGFLILAQLVTALMWCRLFPLLPATAVSERRVGVIAALRLTKKDQFALWAVFIAFFLSSNAIGISIEWLREPALQWGTMLTYGLPFNGALWGAVKYDVRMMPTHLIFSAHLYLAAALNASIMSVAYRELVTKKTAA